MAPFMPFTWEGKSWGGVGSTEPRRYFFGWVDFTSNGGKRGNGGGGMVRNGAIG